MNKEKLIYEFKFLEEKIKKAAILMLHGDKELIEAAWILGGLHTACIENWKKLEEKENG